MAQPLLTSNQVDFPAPLQSCRVATTASLASLSGLLTIDGVTLVATNRVLVKNGTTANPGTTSVDNGVYVAAAGAWSRAPDFDGSPTDETKSGDWVFVTSGTANNTTNWTIATPNPIVVGVTPITFFQSAGAGVGGGFLPLTGGTMSGPIDMGTNNVTNATSVSAGTVTGSIVTTGFGTVGNPGHTFSTDLNTGMYRIGGGGLGLSANSTVGLTISVLGVVSIPNASSTINGFPIGYRNVPRSTTSGTLVTSDVGQCVAVSANIAVPNSTFAAGDVVSIYNDSASSITITASITTLRLAGTASTGNRTLLARGIATIWFNSATEAIISGPGVT